LSEAIMAASLTGLDQRSRDVQILLEAIAEQEAAIKRLEAERAAQGEQAAPPEQDDADQRIFQAYQYLGELRGDLESALQTPIGPEHSIQEEELEAEDESGPNGLAVVIGHSPRGDPGMCGVPPLPAKPEDGKCEYFWNRELAGFIKEELTALDIPCEIFHRMQAGSSGILDAYRQVIRWRPKATVELHFNAHNGTAEGSETIYELSGSKTWAQELQASMVELFGHQGKLSARGSRLDRGIKLASENGRGKLSLVQLSPSALIEPFFGDNTTDATRGVTNKRALAKTIARAYCEFVEAGVSPGTGPVTGPTPGTGTGTITPPITATLWDQLRATYSRARIDFPHLKPITFSQWALESGHGTSELAQQHLNFGGMKFRDFLTDIAQPVLYKGENYCKFRRLEDFITGYWRRFDKIPAYQGWRDHTQTQESYLGFIAPIYAPPSENPNYVPKILSIYERLKAQGTLPAITEGPSEPDNPPQVVGDLAAKLAQVAPADAANFLDLVRVYADRAIPHPALRLVSIAQWALESNWGRSELAKIHFNFAGIEWSDMLKDLAAPVDYKRADGVIGKYARFASLESFCDGYWARFALDRRFADLPAHAANAEAFLGHVTPILRPGDAGYQAKVLNILARLQAALAPTPGRGPVTGPQPNGPPVTDTPAVQDGFVIHVSRSHTEQRPGKKHRTVGRYQVFFNGQKLDGLEGMSFETWGPGDNTTRGVRNGVRLEAKTYPLHTHFGSKTVPDVNGRPRTAFVTHGFTSDERTRIPSMPSLRVGETGARSGVLFHPAEGWIWSIGCLHLSTPLNGPSSNINYKDSRSRVIAVIEAMKAKLGADFPTTNNQPIPGAKVVIAGEPLPGGEVQRDPAEFDAERGLPPQEGVTEDPNFLGDEEAFDLIAATMNGAVSPLLTSHARFAMLAGQRSDILSLRGDAGQNLWSEWAGGWEASFAIGDEAARRFIQADLLEIADALIAAGLPVNDDAGLLTPLTTAASADEFRAVRALHERGAKLDQRNRQGNTPLAVAAFAGAAETVSVLLELGADRTARTAGSEPSADAESGDMEADAFQGPVAAPLWTQEYAETCPPGATPLECAKAGRNLAQGDAERGAAYDRIIVALAE
jgi:hypothetical protein